MSEAKKEHTFEVVLVTQAHAVGKMRNEITVGFGHGREGPWEMPTDEGGFHGGDGTAPPPLAYWAAGFTGCIMTQLRAFSKRLDIPLDGLKVSARFAWTGKQTGREPYVTAPDGFGFDIEIDSPASKEDQIRLVEAAKKGCFIDQTMSVANAVGHRLKVGDDWVEV